MAMQRQLIEKFVIYLCFVCIFDNLGITSEFLRTFGFVLR